MAKSQGTRPIIFVDGDKIRRVRQLGLDEKHPDVPIVALREETEIEEVVPPMVYFEALEEVTGNSEISLGAFRNWEQGSGLPERMMFSKRVERWLQDTGRLWRLPRKIRS